MIPAIGARVRVVRSADEAFTALYLGHIGEVVGYDYTSRCGQTPDDPLIVVEFEDGSRDLFWGEEVEEIA